MLIIAQYEAFDKKYKNRDRVKFFWEKSSAGIELPEFDASFE